MNTNNETKSTLLGLVAEYNSTTDAHFRQYLHDDIEEQLEHLPLEIFTTEELQQLNSILASERLVTALAGVRKLQLYKYRQNNSGGSFDRPYHTVWVVAYDADDANALAEQYFDVYFDGCSTGVDCSCCGDRWYAEYGEGDAWYSTETFLADIKKNPPYFLTDRYCVEKNLIGGILTPEREIIKFNARGVIKS